MRSGAAIADVAAGLYAALGVFTALMEREASGEGQWVQSSLLQAGIGLLDFQAARYTMSGEVPELIGNDHPTSMPTSAYKTADGYINVACSGDGMWVRLCNVLGRSEWLGLPEFKDSAGRAKHRAKLNDLLHGEFHKSDSAHWVETLNKAGVPCGPIYRMDQVFADPQVQHLGAVSEAQHPRLGTLKVLSQVVKLSRTPPGVAAPTPEIGQHTEEILAELGLSQDVSSLRSKGAI
jgi:formyl-CoA transferase